MRAKLIQQQCDIERLNSENGNLSRACDTFVSLVNKSKKRSKCSKARPYEDIYEEEAWHFNKIENYSILEKLYEWKVERGLIKGYCRLPDTRIPRPVNLIEETLKNMGEDSSQNYI